MVLLIENKTFYLNMSILRLISTLVLLISELFDYTTLSFSGVKNFTKTSEAVRKWTLEIIFMDSRLRRNDKRVKTSSSKA
jgi:hypothetical protein